MSPGLCRSVGYEIYHLPLYTQFIFWECCILLISKRVYQWSGSGVRISYIYIFSGKQRNVYERYVSKSSTCYVNEFHIHAINQNVLKPFHCKKFYISHPQAKQYSWLGFSFLVQSYSGEMTARFFLSIYLSNSIVWLTIPYRLHLNCILPFLWVVLHWRFVSCCSSRSLMIYYVISTASFTYV